MKLELTILVCFLVGGYAMELQRRIHSKSEISPYKDIVEKLTQNIKRSGRIVNGTPARLGQFPYQVYLYLLYDEGAFLCGGSVSLISCNAFLNR